jgi:GNAT superfamily N-acetyltransferase
MNPLAAAPAASPAPEDLEYLEELQVRLATVADIPALVELGRAVHEMPAYRQFHYEPNIVAVQLRAIIEGRGPVCRLLVADDRSGTPVGALIASAMPAMFTTQKVCSVQAFWVAAGHAWDGTALRLFRACMKWALSQGVKSIHASVTTGHNMDGVGRFFEVSGFRRTGGTYALPISELGPDAHLHPGNDGR